MVENYYCFRKNNPTKLISDWLGVKCWNKYEVSIQIHSRMYCNTVILVFCSKLEQVFEHMIGTMCNSLKTVTYCIAGIEKIHFFKSSVIGACNCL